MSESGALSDYSDHSDYEDHDHYDDDDEDDVFADEYSLGEWEEDDDEEQYYNETDEETDDNNSDYSDDEEPVIVYSRDTYHGSNRYVVETSEAGKLKKRGWDVLAMMISLSVALVLGYFSVI